MIGRVVVVIDVAALHPLWCRQALFRLYLDTLWQFLKAVQRSLFKHALVLASGDIAKGHEDSIAGVIVAAVEGLQLLVAQVGDVFWVAAAVVVIGAGGEQVFTQLAP